MRNSAAMDVAVNPAQVTTTRAPGCWQDDSVAPALTGDEERRDDPNPPTPPADTYRADANRNAVTSTAARQLRQASMWRRCSPAAIAVTSMGSDRRAGGHRCHIDGSALAAVGH